MVGWKGRTQRARMVALMSLLILLWLSSFTPVAAHAADFTGVLGVSYLSRVTSVAPGFYGHVGVGLADGHTCWGSSVVVLQVDNPKYKDILSSALDGCRDERHGAVLFHWTSQDNLRFRILRHHRGVSRRFPAVVSCFHC